MTDETVHIGERAKALAAEAKTEAEEREFKKAWDVVTKGGGVHVREVSGGRVHVRTRAGFEVVFERTDLPALRATIALLEAR